MTLACLDWSSIFIIKSYWLITIYKRPFSSACLFKALVCSKYIQGRYDEVNWNLEAHKMKGFQLTLFVVLAVLATGEFIPLFIATSSLKIGVQLK